MRELFGEERLCIKGLCTGREDEVTLFSAVEGRMGRLWVDHGERPGCSLVITGDFCYLLGNYNKDVKTDILHIISDLCSGKIIHAEEQWEPVLSELEKKFPSSFRSFSRYALEGRMEWFDPELLRGFVAETETNYPVVRMNEEINRLALGQAWTQDFCSNFNSVQDFMEHGIGYVILQGGEIIAGASSYTYCEGMIEINVETKQEYRKKGLAKACASKLILECLDRKLYPRWDAANIASVALAEKLGYRFDREYVVYSI